MKKQLFTTIITVISLQFTPTGASAEFSLSFNWGNLKKCNTGNPNRVANPNFSLKGVPAGTAELRFKMKDLDVPSYNHGGGKVKYSGGGKVASGAFKYASPCPPGGRHTYEWTVQARDKKGKKLGTAKARRKYP